MSSKYQDLVQQGQKYSSHYKKGLSNHLPMALHALHKLGASEDKLESFYEGYVKRLELITPSDKTVTRENLKDFFAKPEHYESVLTYFKNQIKEIGSKSTINEHLKILSEGISGGAFHPLIRLAYAIEIKSTDEVAHALASWVASYLYLEGKEENSKANFTLFSSLEYLKTAFEDYKPQGYGVFGRIYQASSQEEFQGFINSFDLPKAPLTDMADILIKLYLSSKDSFTALHGVTSCHALRIVLENTGYLEKNIYRYYWEAIGAAYIDIGRIDIEQKFDLENLPSWQEITQKAITSNDDHLIKLVYTCQNEYDHYHNKLYQLAAAKKVKIV